MRQLIIAFLFSAILALPAWSSTLIDDFITPNSGVLAPGNNRDDMNIGTLGGTGADRNMAAGMLDPTITLGTTYGISTVGSSGFKVDLLYDNFGTVDLLIGDTDRFFIGFAELESGITFPNSGSSLRVKDQGGDQDTIDISPALQGLPGGSTFTGVDVLFTDFTNPLLDFDTVTEIELIIDADSAGLELDVFGTAGPPVPEPGTMALLGLAAGIGFVRRKKANNAQTA